MISAALLLVALAAQAAHAQTVSVPFNAGFVGTVGSNTGQANNVQNFSTLGIAKAHLSQPSTTGRFGGTQGNDLSGTLRLVLTNGTAIDVPDAINWRITQGSTLHVFGFIPAPNVAAHTITHSGGTYTLDASSNYGLRRIGSSETYANGSDVNGNAATNDLAQELNDDLAQVAAAGPTITGPTTKTVNEGATAIHAYAANRAVAWSIGGGADAARFAINPATGALAFVAPPDFEAPGDNGADNAYDLVVEATDAAGNASRQTVGVTVGDVNEGDLTPPVVTGPSGGPGAQASARTVSENQAGVATLTADEPVTWSIAGGADAGRFAVNAATGELTFLAAPDFEAPTDADGDNVHDVVVTATDAAGNVGQQAVAVTVGDVAEDATAPQVTGPSGVGGAQARTVGEGQTAVFTFTANETVAWSVGGGPDGARFVIDPATGALTFATPPDFGAPTDADGDNVYLVTVAATDAAGNATRLDLSVTVTDAGAPGIVGPSGGARAAASAKIIDEGTTAVHAFTAGEVVTWSLTGGADAGRFAIDPATGALTFRSGPDFEAPADADADNVYLVTVTATDGSGNASQQLVSVTVADVAEGDLASPAITGPSTRTVAENRTKVATFTADEAVTWSITGGGPTRPGSRSTPSAVR